jgi:hypothetical protein
VKPANDDRDPRSDCSGGATMCNNRADGFGEVTPAREYGPNGESSNLGNHNMRISNRFEKHIVAAAAVAMSAAAAANAAVVYSGVINFVCAVDIDGAYINVETGLMSNGLAPGADVNSWDLNPYGAPAGSGMGFYSPTGGGMVSAAAGGTAITLATGTSIGASSNFGSNIFSVFFGSAAGDWQYGTDNIVGFEFVGADALTHYGWMRFLMGSYSATGSFVTRTVVDYGWENTAATSILAGAGIQAPGIPAPGALALLSAAGLIGARRRRA